jgi:hypothetical protein
MHALTPSAEVALPHALHARVRDSLSKAPTTRSWAIARTRARTGLALILVPALTFSIAIGASTLIYDVPAAGFSLAVQSGSLLSWALVASIALAFATTLIAISSGASGLGSSAVALALVTIAVAPVYAAMILAVPAHTHEIGRALNISEWGTRCFTIASFVAASSLVAFAAALHHAVPSAPRIRGAALGAAAGAWAGLAVLVFCPSGEVQHLLFGHVFPIILATIVGAAVLARYLKP